MHIRITNLLGGRLALLLLLALWGQANADEFDAARFSSIIDDGMRLWHVPGMAVAVIDDGQVVFNRGFGVTAANDGEPVNEHTLFAIASTTKAMVVSGILMLADEGKLDLDDLVIKHIPELHFGEASLSGQLTIRDLLAHRTGLPSTDFWGFEQNMSLEEQIVRLQYVKPIAPPRTRLIYQNTMFEIAGLIIERVSGQRWDRFLSQRLWGPLGMHETFGARGQIPDDMSYARPHNFLEEQLRPVSWDLPVDLADAAGSVWSSVHDMSLWAQFMLRNGVTRDGQRLISEKGMHSMFEPQQLSTPEDFYPTVELTRPHWRSYGLGWFEQDFQGREIDFHTGSLSGLIAIIGLDRASGRAVVVLGNRDHAEMRHALLWEIMDNSDDEGKRDWNRDIFELYQGLEIEAAKDWEEQSQARLADTSTSLPIAAYLGVYRSVINGDITISEADGKASLGTAARKYRLSHWQLDTFLVTDDEWPRGMLGQFSLGTDGKVASFSLGPDTFLRMNE